MGEQISNNDNLESLSSAFPALLTTGYDTAAIQYTNYNGLKPLSLAIYLNAHLKDMSSAFPSLAVVEQMLLISDNAELTVLDGTAFPMLAHTRGGVYLNNNELLWSVAGSFPALRDAFMVFLHGLSNSSLAMAGAFPALKLLQDDLEIKHCNGDLLGLDTAFASLAVIGDYLVRDCVRACHVRV